MKVCWEIKGDWLLLEMSSPEKGWIAVGFNESEKLAGTHLIMGNVKGGKTCLSDRYIVRPGLHKPMEELGAKSLLKDGEGKEHATGTQISFKLSLSVRDPFHQTLQAGKSYYLLMAYSLDDDFSHHSIMRTSVKITL